MAYIGEMQYLTIGNNTYSLPTGGGDGTVTSVGVSNATNGGLSVSGSPITSNGTITIGHSNVLSSAQTTQAVYPIKIDKNGHISAYGSAVTIPTKTSDLTNDSGFITSYTDTKNTAGSTNSASKLYLIGATEQSANPQTYSNSNLYYDSINGFYVKSPTHSNSYSCIKQDNYGCTNIYAYSSSDDMPLSTILASSSEVFLGNRSLEMGYNSSISIIDGDIYLSTGANDKHVYIYNLGAPSNDTDAATKKYVDDSVGALTIPTKTSDLTNDSGFITSYTDEKLKWTASTSSNTYYPLQSTSTATTSTANTLNGISFYQYYNTAGGYRRLDLGNSTAYKSTGGAYGTIRLYGAAATYYGDLVPGVLGTTSGDGHISANRTWTLPDKTGTIALISDIPTYTDTNTWRPIQLNGTQILAGTTGTNALNLKAGTNISLSNSSGTVTINGPDLSGYAQSSAIPTETTVSGWGFTKNTGTLTGVTFAGTSMSISSGVASITQANARTALGLATVATSGSYNDLTNKPTLTDTKVTQTVNSTESTNRMLLMSDYAPSNNTTHDGGANTSSYLYFQPSTGKLTAGYNTNNAVAIQPTLMKFSYSNNGANYVLSLQIPDLSAVSNPTPIVTLPNKTGTVALTSDIPDVSGFVTTDENVKSTAVTAATTNYIVGSTTSTTTTGGLSKHASGVLYTTADSGTSGYTQLILGNTTATTSAGGKEGQIRLYGTNATYYLDLKPGAITSSNKTITFPNKTGTVALIPTEGTGGATTNAVVYNTINGFVSIKGAYFYQSTSDNECYLSLGGNGGNGKGSIKLHTSDTNWAVELAPINSLSANRTITLPNKDGTVALTSDIPAVPTITLNGSSTTSPLFYAPTSAGTSGYVLTSNGSGAPTWQEASGGAQIQIVRW